MVPSTEIDVVSTTFAGCVLVLWWSTGCKDATSMASKALIPLSLDAGRTVDAGGAPVGVVGTVQIAGGEFRMGTTQGAPSERPVHGAHVATFDIDRTEVTVAAYLICVKAGSCRPLPSSQACRFSQSGFEGLPVACVSWFDAEGYCKSIGRRLPTEEEWEYAARGRNGRTYPWGTATVDGRACWNRWAKREGPCPVGSHTSGDTPEGVHDLAGNVWEWTASAWSSDYRSPGDPATRVTRGGGWGDSLAENLRSTARGHRPPEYRSDTIGFRCAR